MEAGLVIGRSVHYFFLVALLILLVRGYVKSRNVGFVWLGAALIFWPEIVGLIAPHIRAGTSTLLGPVEYAIGSTLLLIGVICLGQSRPIGRARTT